MNDKASWAPSVVTAAFSKVASCGIIAIEARSGTASHAYSFLHRGVSESH